MSSLSHITPLPPTTTSLPSTLIRPELTFNEIYRSIPPQGVKVADFAARFKERTAGEERFKTLINQARRVAHLDLEKLVLQPRKKPTPQEIRDAIPAEGICLADLIARFEWMELSSHSRAQMAKSVDQIAVQDPSTGTFRLKGEITAEEVISAVPGEGIVALELYRMFKARFSDAEQYRNFILILVKVAMRDLQSDRIVLQNADSVISIPPSMRL